MKLATGQGTKRGTGTGSSDGDSRVVTYDLSTIRAKVKQTKRARAAARRRLALQRAEQQAAAVEAARTAALRVWDAEEARLASAPKDEPNPEASTSHNRRVHFSETLTVTAIPSQHADTLPKAVKSVARLEDGPREEEVVLQFGDIDIEDDESVETVDNPDDLEDPEDTEYKPVALTTLNLLNAVDSTTGDSAGVGGANPLKRRRNPARRARVEATTIASTASLVLSSIAASAGSQSKQKQTGNGVTRTGSVEKSKKKRRKEEKAESMASETKEVQKEGNAKGTKEGKDNKARKENGKSSGGEANGTPSKKRRASSDMSSEVDDLDAIFSALKSKAARTSPSGDKKKSLEKANRSSDVAGSSANASASPNSGERRRRYTEEGYRIYTETELVEKSNSAGLAGPCPFDCSCCH